MNDAAPDKHTAATAAWRNLLDAWPVFAVIGSFLLVMFIAFFESEVSKIADARINAMVPTTQGVQDIKADITSIKLDINTLKSNDNNKGSALARVEGDLNRVEAKLDNLILILQRRE